MALKLLVNEGKLEWDKPIFSFRENFKYQNQGYILAAHTQWKRAT